MAQDTSFKSQALTQPQRMQGERIAFAGAQSLGQGMARGAQGFVHSYQAQQQIEQRGAEGRVRMMTEQLRQDEINQKMAMIDRGSALEMQGEQLRAMRLQNDAVEYAAAQQQEGAGRGALSASQSSKIALQPTIDVNASRRTGETRWQWHVPGQGWVTDQSQERANLMLQMSGARMGKEPTDLESMATLSSAYARISESFLGDPDLKERFEEEISRLLDERNRRRDQPPQPGAAPGGAATPVNSAAQAMTEREQALDAAASSMLYDLRAKKPFVDNLLRITKELNVAPEQVEEAVAEFIKGAMMLTNPPSEGEIKKRLMEDDAIEAIRDYLDDGGG